MSYEQAAKEAFQYARNKIRLKSNNKLNYSKLRVLEYTNRLGEAEKGRKDIFDKLGGMPKPIPLDKISEMIEGVGAGNCMEYTVVCLNWLRTNGKATNKDSGYVSFSGMDHCCAQIGFPVPVDKKYPMKFDDWGEAWIIDPWLNICCPAKAFPVAFSKKMEKWDEKEKRIDGAYGEMKATRWGENFANIEKLHMSMFD